MGGSARRPGRITFAAKVSATVVYCWNKCVEMDVPDAMLDDEEGIWYGDAVGSVLEGLAERDLVS